MKATTLGLSLLAGAALVETALIPGLVIGGTAVVASKLFSQFKPKGQRRPRSSTIKAASVASKAARVVSAAAPQTPEAKPPLVAAPTFAVKEAIIKTITFRMIATSLDFTANMLVIGDFTTAASLSAFGLVAAPFFYFGHELFWAKLAPAGTKVDIGELVMPRSKTSQRTGHGLVLNRALAKTITYEVVAVTVDFSANFIATGDVAAASVLTVFALIVSPFIYYGHEKAWGYFGALKRGKDDSGVPHTEQRSRALLLAAT
ncbi:MAG: DUF2061 domain-containing protein [Methylovirgula sp.]